MHEAVDRRVSAFAAVNHAAAQWRDTIANARLHGEIRQKPRSLLEREKSLLKPLPVMPHDCSLTQPLGLA